ncbi:MAG: transposase [Isosphaeraceae bacterium]|nr:transposase [Isosphaeraceae bacterium]
MADPAGDHQANRAGLQGPKAKRRWVIERTCAGLGRWRRLSTDYEQTTGSSEAFIKLARVPLMACQLVKRLNL